MEPIVRPTVTEEIVNRLIRLILDQGLTHGDKLPSERELCEQLGVGRPSLREAVKTLSAVGIVEVAVGEGMFVGNGEALILSKPLSWRLLMAERTAAEVMEARRLVEVELATQAARRATPDEVAAIGEQLEQMRRSTRDAQQYSGADLGFHLAIARAAHNVVLVHILTALQQLIRLWVVENVTSDPGEALQALAEHEPILAAIRARRRRRRREGHGGAPGRRRDALPERDGARRRPSGSNLMAQTTMPAPPRPAFDTLVGELNALCDAQPYHVGWSLKDVRAGALPRPRRRVSA